MKTGAIGLRHGAEPDRPAGRRRDGRRPVEVGPARTLPAAPDRPEGRFRTGPFIDPNWTENSR